MWQWLKSHEIRSKFEQQIFTRINFIRLGAKGHWVFSATELDLPAWKRSQRHGSLPCWRSFSSPSPCQTECIAGLLLVLSPGGRRTISRAIHCRMFIRPRKCSRSAQPETMVHGHTLVLATSARYRLYIIRGHRELKKLGHLTDNLH